MVNFVYYQMLKLKFEKKTVYLQRKSYNENVYVDGLNPVSIINILVFATIYSNP